jgi:hypothetical protein
MGREGEDTEGIGFFICVLTVKLQEIRLKYADITNKFNNEL